MLTSIMAFSCVHLRPHAEFSTPTEDGLTTHLQEGRDSLCWVGVQIRDRRPQVVVCLGDFFDAPDAIDTRSLHIGAEALADLQRACEVVGAEFHLLVGNHDRFSAGYHTLTVFRDRVTKLWETPGVHEVRGTRILMLPFEEHLPEIHPDFQRVDVVCSHQRLVGATLYGPRKEETGLSPMLWGTTPILQGHYHEPHRYQNVWCPGSLLAKSFHDQEAAYPRGLIWLERQEGREWQGEFIGNPCTGIYCDVHVDEDLRSLDDALEKVATDSERRRCRIYFGPEQTALADSLRQVVQHARLVPQQVEARERAPVELDPSQSPATILETYVLGLAADDEKVAAIAPELLGCLEQLLEAGSRRVKTGVGAWVRRIHLQNFFSWEDLQIGLPERGLTLVEGLNGHGKSALIVEAIYWALTGKVARGGMTGDDVVREGQPQGSVTLDLLLIDDRQVQVLRSRVIGGRGKFEVTISGGGVTGHLKKSTQDELDKLLGLEERTLRATSFLFDDMSAAFSRLQPKARLELLEEALHLEVYDEMLKAAQASLSEVQAQRGRLLSRRDFLQEQITQAETKLDPARPGSPAQMLLTARLALTTSDVAAELREVETFVAQERVAIEEIDYAIARSEERRSGLESQHAKHQEEVNGHAQKMGQARGRLEAVRQEAATKRELLAQGKCPTCGQGFSEELEHSCQEIEQRVVRYHEILTRVEQAYESSRQVLDSCSAARNVLRSDIATERHRRASKMDTIAAKEGKKRKLESQVQELETAVAQAQGRVAEVEATLERSRSEFTEALRGLEESRQPHDVWSWWVQALGKAGLRMWLVSQGISFMNAQVATFASSLLPFSVRCGFENVGKTVTKDELTLQLEGTTRRFGSLSRGQKRAIDWCFQMAFHALARATSSTAILNLLVADEVVDAIDVEKMTVIIDILRDVAKDRPVFLTTHSPHLRALIPDRWRVEADADGVSRLVI